MTTRNNREKPKFSAHWGIKTDLSLTPPVLLFCGMILILMLHNEPDLLDALIQLIYALTTGHPE